MLRSDNQYRPAEQETIILPDTLVRSATNFRAYLKRYKLSSLDVSLVARVRYLTIWNIENGHPIGALQAQQVHAGLQRLTGIPYLASIATHTQDVSRRSR
ncbi:hypothetical protein EPA93_36475 [Ktedonosporobacter rubrisoli]|uniref:XRE family transcriptional regulator n=1 Tax=Ktedonosporobacter rubrisoli TaxID=2509675 RepID=A0A4P6JZ71_KTERU|nr:hypothetical protein [Ktedonosporobacter rubrisoli]QBD81178.1 hypothetical protein EPA93_36475 [Ktedonosporobacter rubrisoli]